MVPNRVVDGHGRIALRAVLTGSIPAARDTATDFAQARDGYLNEEEAAHLQRATGERSLTSATPEEASHV